MMRTGHGWARLSGASTWQASGAHPQDRITLLPLKSTRDDLDYIIKGGFVTPEHKSAFRT